MSNTNTSPNMNLPVPVVGVDPGPQWGEDLNSCLALIDQHNHAPGSGVQINPAGININIDLPMGNNNLTLARSIRFSAQNSPLATATDLDCAYVSGVDLYYNDGNGNQVRITQSGAVAGSPGSIANLTSPASASYVSANQTFVWQSDANTPANMDGASYILRNLTANSKSLTLSPPAAMGANYTLTLPTIPATSGNFITMDTSGNMNTLVSVDNLTLDVSSNLIEVKDGGITGAKIANTTIPAGKLAADSVATVNIIDANVTAAKLADNAVTLPKLDTSTVRPLIMNAGVNFNSIQLSGTYARALTLITVTATAHGLTTGQYVLLDFTTGTASDGYYQATVTGANTFTVTDAVSGTTSGNVTLKIRVYSSNNVTSMSYDAAGNFTLTFTTAFTNANYYCAGMVQRSTTVPSQNGAWVNFLSGITTPKTTTTLKLETIVGNAGPQTQDFPLVSVIVIGY